MVPKSSSDLAISKTSSTVTLIGSKTRARQFSSIWLSRKLIYSSVSLLIEWRQLAPRLPRLNCRLRQAQTTTQDASIALVSVVIKLTSTTLLPEELSGTTTTSDEVVPVRQDRIVKPLVRDCAGLLYQHQLSLSPNPQSASKINHYNLNTQYFLQVQLLEFVCTLVGQGRGDRDLDAIDLWLQFSEHHLDVSELLLNRLKSIIQIIRKPIAVFAAFSIWVDSFSLVMLPRCSAIMVLWDSIVV